MVFSLVEAVLAVALLTACLRVVAVHRALVQLRAYHEDYHTAFEKTAAALAAVRAVLSERNTHDYQLSTRLASLVAEARKTIDEIEVRMSKLEQERAAIGERQARAAVKDADSSHPAGPAVVAPSHAAFAFCRRVGRPMTQAIAEG